MSFSDAVRSCLRNYVTFSGRASRPEYWFFILFNILASVVLGLVDRALFETPSDGPIAGLFSLAMILPLLAAGWRRMHDSGRSGLYLLYPIIAILGTVSFAGFLRGFDLSDPILTGVDMPALGTLASFVLIAAMIVCVLSPLLVLWWLTRPTEPRENRWGPVPTAGRTVA